MKNYFTLVFVLICYVSSLAQTPIWTEDFDGANTNSSVTFSEQCGDDKDYFGIVCQNGAGCANEISADFAFFGASGQYFGIRDADADPCSSTFPKSLSLTEIDISSCAGETNVTYICFDLAESRNMGDDLGAEWSTSNSREDTWDGNSNVSFTASINGGNAQQITALEAFDNSDTRAGIDVNCDGKADDAGEPELTDTFTKYCFELPGQGTSLDLIITVDGLNTQGEDLAIDNIEIYCESDAANLPATLLDACTPFVYVEPGNANAIWSENFDGSNTTNPPVFSEQCGDDKDYFDIVCQNGEGCTNEISADFAFFDASGQYFGVRDADADPCTSTFPKTLSFNGIDISSCSGASNVTYICLDLAESRNMGDDLGAEWSTSNSREDTWDGSSTVSFTASIDGGSAQQVTALEAFDGSDTRAGIDVNCDGKADDTGEPELTDTFTKYCFELPGQGASLDLVINVDGLNTQGEDLAIDNIEIFCESSTANLPGTLLDACTPFVYVEPGPANAIWSENFDGSNTTNPPVFSEQCSDDKDYFDIVCPNGAGCPNEINSDFTFFNASGQHFGIRDPDADPCSSVLFKTLSFNGIDISSCSGGGDVTYICFDLAESRNMGDEMGAEWGTSNMREDTWDSNSSVSFTANIDGTGAQIITTLEAFENSDTRPGVDVNCDGKANDPGEPELTDTFTKYCFELPTQGASLDLVINVDGLNTQGEDLAIDNIEIFCESNPADLPDSGTLLASCTPFVAIPLTVVWSEDFDGSNTGPSFAFSAGCDPTPSRDYLGIICLDGVDCPNEMNADYVYFGAQGQFMGARDMDASCGGSLDETVTALGIDISSCAGSDHLYLCFDMAESSAANALNDRETNSDDGTEDTWDGSASVSFSITIDGVITEVIAIESSNGTDTRPAIDNNCGGGSADGSLLTDTFTTYCFELPSLGSSADLSVQFLELNTDGEDLAIDNFGIYCEESAEPLPVPLTTPCYALPIELTSFEAIANGEVVDLKWVTETETNNDYFSIERSLDALNFEEIAKVDGAGNSYQTLTYTATDREPNIGLNYYRLKQVDFDGQYSYSEIRTVIVGRKHPISISPNPVSDMLYVQSGSGQISIFDALGQLVFTQAISQEGSFEFDVSELASGTYFIVHTNESGEENTLKFIKLD